MAERRYLEVNSGSRYGLEPPIAIMISRPRRSPTSVIASLRQSIRFFFLSMKLGRSSFTSMYSPEGSVPSPARSCSRCVPALTRAIGFWRIPAPSADPLKRVVSRKRSFGKCLLPAKELFWRTLWCGMCSLRSKETCSSRRLIQLIGGPWAGYIPQPL